MPSFMYTSGRPLFFVSSRRHADDKARFLAHCSVNHACFPALYLTTDITLKQECFSLSRILIQLKGSLTPGWVIRRTIRGSSTLWSIQKKFSAPNDPHFEALAKSRCWNTKNVYFTDCTEKTRNVIVEVVPGNGKNENEWNVHVHTPGDLWCWRIAPKKN